MKQKSISGSIIYGLCTYPSKMQYERMGIYESMHIYSVGKKTLILLCNILHYFHNECGRIQLNVKTFEISCSEALYYCFSLQE